MPVLRFAGSDGSERTVDVTVASPPSPAYTKAGPTVEVTTNNRELAFLDVLGNIVLQDKVSDTWIHDCDLHDGHSDVVGGVSDRNALIFSSGTKFGDPANNTLRNTRIGPRVRIWKFGIAGLNLRDFDGCFVDDVDISLIDRSSAGELKTPKQHTDVARTYNGGRNLQMRNVRMHDSGAIGFFIKDGAVDWVRLEDCRWWNITGGFKTMQLYRATNVALIRCNLGGGSVTLAQGCSIYIDEATLPTIGAIQDVDGTTVWLASDPWESAQAPLRAW